MQLTNYYQILEIASDSEVAEIKKSFREKVQFYHPDKNQSPEAPAKFREVVEAYEVLSDTEKRSHYDRWLQNSLQNKLVVIPQQEEAKYKEWKNSANQKAQDYSIYSFDDLLLLDAFKGDQIIEGLLDGAGELADGASDLFDDLFDLF
ncbi:MAG: DnaJ domain-containing protein [bacterium]